MDGIGIGERAAWGSFPSIVRNGGLGSLSREPEYHAAKCGGKLAALDLVSRLMTVETINQVRSLIAGSDARLVPVLAVEHAGNNKIPLAMAEVLGDRLGLDVELGIVQREKIGRTGAGSDHRLAFNPTFAGDVSPGQRYLILDDTLTMGGTVASLRGYIENRGGHVVGASVMAAHDGALDLPVKSEMLVAIGRKHGLAMDTYWKETFGYGIDFLTQGEAGHIRAAASVDAIRTRITAARHAGIERLDEGRAQAATRTVWQPSPGSAEVRPTASSAEGEDSLEAAETAEREQRTILETAQVEQTYQNLIEVHVEAKHAQVGRIEDRLESLIERQQTKLQAMQSKPPGLLALPSTRRAWQVQQAQAEFRLQTLHHRLEVVREIKEGMGHQAPKIEELATRKMRAENPGLASDWDAVGEAARRHQIHMRQQKERDKKQQESARGQSLGLSNRPT